VLLLTPSATRDAPGPATEWLWAQTADGQRASAHGQSTAAALPTDADTVLLVPPQLLSWHSVAVPKVAASRLRAVLDGLLEDRLLDDAGQMHFALAPGGKPGQTLWVAAQRADWLRTALATLRASGHAVSRVAPLMWPQPELSQRAFERNGQTWLAAAGPLGVVCAPWQTDTTPATWQALLHSVAPTESGEADPPATCLSEPACAAQAELALQRPPGVAGTAEQLLLSAQGPWDLAQFDFSQSAQARRGHWLRDTGRALQHAPAWRPVRWGLVALVLLQVAALNVTAWRSQQALKDKQAQIRQTLTQTFPQVTLVLDAPVQMRRALADLRQVSGEASPRDLEALLQALAAASPQWDSLEYGPGEVTLQGFRAAPNAGRDWQSQLEAAGWAVQLAGEPPVLTLKARP
jgi:general secretion pathway protein L